MPASLSSVRSKQASGVVPLFKVVAGDRETAHPLRLDRAVCVVGRQPGSNLALPAPQVSKLHALLVRDPRRGVYVRDLASTNGVEVNGLGIREAALRDADVVRIGAYTLQCEAGFGQPAGQNGDGAVAHDAAPAAEIRAGDRTFAFKPGRSTLLIGSRPGCEVQLKDPSVAPVHAILFELEGRHYVQTFAGEATSVNGKPARREELKDGDELRVGNVLLTYAMAETAPEEAATSADDLAPIDIEPLDAAPAESMSVAEAASDDHAYHGEIVHEHGAALDDVHEVDGVHLAASTDDSESRADAGSQTLEELEPLPVEAQTPQENAPASRDDVQIEIEPLHDDDIAAATEPAEEDPIDVLLASEAPAPIDADVPVSAAAPTVASLAAMESEQKPQAIGSAPPKPAMPQPAIAQTTAAPLARSLDASDEDLTDVAPFDLGSDEAAQTPAAVDLESAALAAAKAEDDVLAALGMPAMTGQDDLAATLDEDAGLMPLAVSETESPAEPVVEAEPAEMSASAMPVSPVAADQAAHAEEAPLNAEPGDHRGDDADAATDAKPETPTDESTRPHQAARLAKLAELAGLESFAGPAPSAADDDAAPPPSLAQIEALVEEIVAKTQRLQSLWARYRAAHDASERP